MIKIIKGAILLMAVCSFFDFAYAAKDAVEIPGDFKLTAIAGGLAPGMKVSKVEIGAKGHCIYSEAGTGNNDAGSFVEKARFSLEEPAMRFIYETIISNNFFSLEKNYKAEGVLDGNFASLAITMDNKTHSVRTRNIRTDRFDNIMIAVNIVLPADKKIIYNEIIDL